MGRLAVGWVNGCTDSWVGGWILTRRITELWCLVTLCKGSELFQWKLGPHPSSDADLSVTLSPFLNVSKPRSLTGKENVGPCPARLTQCWEGH